MLQQRGNIVGRYRQVFEYLKDCNGSCYRAVEFSLGVTIGHPLDAVNNVAITSLNIASKRIIEGDSIGQCTNLCIGQNRFASRPSSAIEEDILKHLNCRSKP